MLELPPRRHLATGIQAFLDLSVLLLAFVAAYLWNVLRGDMSLVGPRPEVPRFVRLADPIWQKVLSARPGITDPVTLVLRSEADLLAGIEGDTEQFYVNELQPAKLKGYVAYLEERSWRTDLSVLWRTMVAVVVPGKASLPLRRD